MAQHASGALRLTPRLQDWRVLHEPCIFAMIEVAQELDGELVTTLPKQIPNPS